MGKKIFPGAGVGTFWARGSLSPLEQASLLSLKRRGIDATVFSYEPLQNLPAGVHSADAADIIPLEMTQHVIYGGKPDLAHFSDIFRYEMISQRNLAWMDLDVIMIGDGDFSAEKNIIVQEEQGGINGAVLYISDQGILKDLLEGATRLFDRELRWGETGPVLLQKAIGTSPPKVPLTSHKYFYPIEHYDVWKLLLPEYFDFCMEKCSEATSLHLFNNILTTIGYWKSIAPPKGSYLHHALEKNELIHLFTNTYPDGIMRNIVDNFRYRQNGKALGVRAIVREFIPSISRTWHHYRK